MRRTREVTGSLGAGVALPAAVACLALAIGGLVAFSGWPGAEAEPSPRDLVLRAPDAGRGPVARVAPAPRSRAARASRPSRRAVRAVASAAPLPPVPGVGPVPVAAPPGRRSAASTDPAPAPAPAEPARPVAERPVAAAPAPAPASPRVTVPPPPPPPTRDVARADPVGAVVAPVAEGAAALGTAVTDVGDVAADLVRPVSPPLAEAVERTGDGIGALLGADGR